MEARVALYVGCGGICGAVARWGLGEVLDSGSDWPWSIFVANLVGALALGLLTARFPTGSAPALIAATTGFCGALTTFATFAVDLAVFLRDDRFGLAGSYLVASMALGLFAFRAGQALAAERPR